MGISKAKKGVIHRGVYKDGTVTHRWVWLSTGLYTDKGLRTGVRRTDVRGTSVRRTDVRLRFPWAGVPQLFENSVNGGVALHQILCSHSPQIDLSKPCGGERCFLLGVPLMLACLRRGVWESGTRLFYVSRWWKGSYSLPLWLSLPIGNLDTPAFSLRMFKYAALISRSDLRLCPLDTCFNNRQVICGHLNTDAVEPL